jgi:hypothetical protein
MKNTIFRWQKTNFHRLLADGMYLMKITHLLSAPTKDVHLSLNCSDRWKVSIPETKKKKKKNDRRQRYRAAAQASIHVAAIGWGREEAWHYCHRRGGVGRRPAAVAAAARGPAAAA